MKKYLMLGMLVASIQAVAVEYSVNVGLDPFRRTAVESTDESTDESADIGLSLGGESIWSKDKLVSFSIDYNLFVFSIILYCKWNLKSYFTVTD